MQGKIALVCEEVIAFQSLAIMVSRSLKCGKAITVFTRRANYDLVDELFSGKVEVRTFENLGGTVRKFAFDLVDLFFTDDALSNIHRSARLGKYGRFLCFLAKKLKLYRFLSSTKIMGFDFWSADVFEEFDEVCSFSRLSRPYLFYSVNQRHTHIVESWDHPYKGPWHVRANQFIVWNKSMRDAVCRLQSGTKIKTTFPLKMLFSRQPAPGLSENREAEIKKHYFEDVKFLETLDHERLVVYAMAYSTHNPTAFEIETKFVRYLSGVIGRLGGTLYIKPKPISCADADFLPNPGRNLYVGANPRYEAGVDLLSNNYRSYIDMLLRSAKVVLDSGSSFMLEAAEARTPVIKLRHYGNAMAHMAKNPHLAQLGEHVTEHDVKNLDWEALIKRPSDFSCGKEIREWLRG